MADKSINSLTNNEVVKQGDNELRRTVQHLPAFYRTDSNQRFLSSTLDPLVQKGELERLDGYIGKQDAYTRTITDRYIGATNRDRMAYQLEPAVTYTDKDTTSINPEDQVKFSGTYDDYINQIKYFGGKIDNHDRLNKEHIYSWNPAVDYDKLINYREYYWVPAGPTTIEIDSVGTLAVAEYNVNVTNGAYSFPHKGNTSKFRWIKFYITDIRGQQQRSRWRDSNFCSANRCTEHFILPVRQSRFHVRDIEYKNSSNIYYYRSSE